MNSIEGKIIGDLMASMEKTGARLVLFTPSGVITGRPVRLDRAGELQGSMAMLAKLIDETYRDRQEEFLVLRDVSVRSGQLAHEADFMVVFLHTVTGVTLGG